MEYLLSFAFTATELVSISFAADAIFKRRDKNIFNFYAVLGLNVLISIALSMILQTYSPIIKVPIILLLMFAMLSLNYKGKWWYKLFLCLVFVALGSVLDYIVLSLNMLLFSCSYTMIMQNSAMYMVTAVTSKLIMLITAYSFKKLRCRKTHKGDIVTTQAWALLVVPAFSVFNIFAVFESSIRNNEISLLSFTIAIGLLLCNIVAVFLWEKLEDDNRLRLDNALLAQELKSNMDKTLALESLYVAQRKKTHDFQNHTRTLQGLLKSGAFNQADEYIQKLTQTQMTSGETVRTNNQLLDIVFNQKYEYAKQNGVTISFLVNDLSKLPIEDQDIVTLLTNLLDNAIEAALLCQGEKTIRLKMMRRIGVNLLVSVGNSSIPVEIVDNQVFTTKDHPMEHGFGLQNIRHLIEQYDGQFLLSYSNGWFQFTAILPIKTQFTKKNL